jgi:uncharacterized membrane protein YbhN (UPF0104 family)
MRSRPARAVAARAVALSRGTRGSLAIAVAVALVLVVALGSRRGEFVAALHAAPIGVLVLAAVLQAVALLSRTEAWHGCVKAAGGSVGRRCLYRASSMSCIGGLINAQLGAAARIAALRRSAPKAAPRIPALIGAELPIVAVEAALAALFSFTLVGPLGLPWWVPLIGLAVIGAAVLALGDAARRGRRAFFRGLAILRSARGRVRLVALVLVAVLAQIARNWLMLRAVGVPISLLDSIALLIAMVTLGQLPIGPSVGAAAAVVVLGPSGVVLVAAAGVLLTVTGTAGALAFVAWAGVDRITQAARDRAPSPRVTTTAPAVPKPRALPVAAPGATP